MDKIIVADARNRHQSLEAELETVFNSYREEIDGAQQAANELIENMFATIRDQLENVEVDVIRNSLASTDTKIKVLTSLCNNLSAMENAFLDLKSRYAEAVDQNVVVSDTEPEHGAKCLLDFGKGEETVSP